MHNMDIPEGISFKKSVEQIFKAFKQKQLHENLVLTRLNSLYLLYLMSILSRNIKSNKKTELLSIVLTWKTLQRIGQGP